MKKSSFLLLGTVLFSLYSSHVFAENKSVETKVINSDDKVNSPLENSVSDSSAENTKETDDETIAKTKKELERKLKKDASKQVFDRIMGTVQKNTHPFWSITADPRIGIRHGKVGEYVINNSSKSESNVESYLSWPFDNEYYAGMDITGTLFGVFAQFEMEGGAANSNTGLMLDFDWLNNTYNNSKYHYLTNYSESTTYMDYDFYFGGKLGYSFNLFDMFFITPFAGYSYNNIKFTARYGKYWYGKEFVENRYNIYYPYNSVNEQTGDKNYSEGTFDSAVVSYNRETINYWLGINLKALFPFGLNSNFEFKIAPYTQAASLDYHIIRKTYFNDSGSSSFGAYKLSFGVGYAIDANHSFGMNYNTYTMYPIVGPTYMGQKLTQMSLVKDGASASDESYWELCFYYRFTF